MGLGGPNIPEPPSSTRRASRVLSVFAYQRNAESFNCVSVCTSVKKVVIDPDAQLMLQVRNGNQAAFKTLVEKYQGPITNLIYHMMLNHAEAEELAQEVFLKVYQAAARYRSDAKFSTWLYRIATNLSLNELKSRRGRKTVSLEESLLDRAASGLTAANRIPDPASQLERRELAKALERALQALPERQRVAVILQRFEGFSYREVADSMGCSVEAVEALLSRAKISLKESLAGYR